MDEIFVKPKFINDSDISEKDYLWKFVSLDKFFSFVLNQKIYLTRLDKFEDIQEGISPDYLLFNHTRESLKKLPPFNQFSSIMGIDMFPADADKFLEEFQKYQESHFASCWFLSKENIESTAMWNLYSTPNSFAIRINYNNFKSNFNKFLFDPEIVKDLSLGCVQYCNFQNPIELEEKKKTIKSSFFLKDSCFEHEKEFRIVAAIEPYEMPEKKYKKRVSKEYQDKFYKNIECIGINLILENFSDFNFEFVLHPKSGNWVKNDFTNILKRLDIPIEIIDSKLKLR